MPDPGQPSILVLGRDTCEDTTRSREHLTADLDLAAAQGDGAYLKLRENVLAGTPYPVKGWMIAKQDPLNALPDQSKTLRMIEQMDFIAAIDVQMSDTAWYADVLFPESAYLERWDPIEVLSGIWPVVVLRLPQDLMPERLRIGA